MNNKLVELLNVELIPAMGCTEPIAICYCAAKVVEILGNQPDKMVVHCSGSMYKNAKGVKIPNTNGLKGVAMSAIIGAIGGNASKELEVLEDITLDHLSKAKELNNSDFIKVALLDCNDNINIIIEGYYQDDKVSVEIKENHTKIVRIMKNNEIIFIDDSIVKAKDHLSFSFNDVINFVETIDYLKVKPIIDKQITYNMKVAMSGFEEGNDLQIGPIYQKIAGDSVYKKGIALVAAACDARMSGVNLAAFAVGGSGSQGIACSLPVYNYGKENSFSEEEITIALALSNLTFLYIKEGIGRLSAYCSGVVSSAAVVAAITYLDTKDFEKVKMAIINTLGNISGVLCDGAKSSCALKVTSALEASELSYEMAKKGIMIEYDTGVLGLDFETSIRRIGELARLGMQETNNNIIDLMYES